ncbi:MAG: hypothetical protein ABI680_16620 [Chthoniobacteraceae bacterium]
MLLALAQGRFFLLPLGDVGIYLQPEGCGVLRVDGPSTRDPNPLSIPADLDELALPMCLVLEERFKILGVSGKFGVEKGVHILAECIFLFPTVGAAGSPIPISNGAAGVA